MKLTKYLMRNRKVQIILTLSAIMLSSTALVILAFSAVRQHNLKIGRESLARAREADLPINMAELQRWANKHTDSPSCGAAFQDAFDLMNYDEQQRLIGPLLKDSISRILDAEVRHRLDEPGLKAAVDELLQSNEAAVIRLKEALDDFSPCHFTFADVDDTSVWPKSETRVDGVNYRGAIQYFANQLVLSGYTEIDNRNFRSASESVVYLLKLARLLRDEPLLASQYLRQDLLFVAFRLLETIMSDGDVDPLVTPSILALCKSQELGNPLYLAFVGGFANAVPAFDPQAWKEREGERFFDPYTQQEREVDRSIQWTRVYLTSAWGLEWQGNETFYRFFTFFYDGLGLWSLDRRSMVEKSLIAFEQIAPEESGNTYSTSPYSNAWDRKYCIMARRSGRYSYTDIPINRAPGELTKEVRWMESKVIVPTRLMVVALAVDKFWRAKGVYPQALAELVPNYLEEVPLDPFDGDPLKYSLRRDRWVLYSIGNNETDDGGSREAISRSSMRGEDGLSWNVEDIVFSVLRGN